MTVCLRAVDTRDHLFVQFHRKKTLRIQRYGLGDRAIDQTRTIEHETSTHGQDENSMSEAKYTTGQNASVLRDEITIGLRTSPQYTDSHRSVQWPAGSGKPDSVRLPMKQLINRAMYHPLIALSMFNLADLMCRGDYGLSGALLVLAAKSMSRLLRLVNKV
jgi:hypothetical protein